MSDFINRNRVFWMNTRGVVEIKVIVNDDLFNVPKDVAIRDDVAFNIKHSDRPLAVGIMSYMCNDTREYLAYGNDSLGKAEWVESFDTFRDALSFAKKTYIRDMDEMYYDYMYNESVKVSRK